MFKKVPELCQLILRTVLRHGDLETILIISTVIVHLEIGVTFERTSECHQQNRSITSSLTARTRCYMLADIKNTVIKCFRNEYKRT